LSAALSLFLARFGAVALSPLSGGGGGAYARVRAIVRRKPWGLPLWLYILLALLVFPLAKIHPSGASRGIASAFAQQAPLSNANDVCGPSAPIASCVQAINEIASACLAEKAKPFTKPDDREIVSCIAKAILATGATDGEEENRGGRLRQ
jgi:hypothetical protein